MIKLKQLVEVMETGNDYSTRTFTYRRFTGFNGHCVMRLRNSYFGTTNEIDKWQMVAATDEYNDIYIDLY